MIKLDFLTIPEHVINALKEEVKLQFPQIQEHEIMGKINTSPFDIKENAFSLAKTSPKYGDSFVKRLYFWNKVLYDKKYHLIPNTHRIEQDGEVYNI